MKSRVKISLLLIMSFVFFSFSNVATTAEQSQHKIVIFKDGVNDSKTSEIIAKVGGSIKKPLPLIHGKAIVLPTKAAEKVLNQYPEVLRIDDDIEITVTKAPATSVQPTQSLPWGVDLIDAELAWVSTTGQAVKVAIIDTGVDRNHPDLVANIKGGINTINLAKTYQDDNGHGTHVAGIIGAVNNSIGVVGTAPQVEIYAVKALDRTGSGYLSDIIEGLQWAVTNQMQVINMSLGTNSDNQSFHDAITAVYNAGIIQVAAAGNDGPTDYSVDFPAKYPETLAVSAIDSLGQIPSWSSQGPEVDLAAPGVNINSTWNNDLYKVISGTSMATPHVTGTVALTIASKGQMAPDAIKVYLKSKAKNLGLPTNLQGGGLVDALASVQ